jgi:cbb3-type cytochrome oxidase subunit 3
MMKDVVRALETGALAQVGLLAFVLAFVIVVVWAFTMSRRSRDAAKRLPLDED